MHVLFVYMCWKIANIVCRAEIEDAWASMKSDTLENDDQES